MGEVDRARISSRQMPPWHIDKTVGIQKFKNGGNRALDIPPNQVTTTENFVVLRENARIENFQAHLHLREGLPHSLASVVRTGVDTVGRGASEEKNRRFRTSASAQQTATCVATVASTAHGAASRKEQDTATEGGHRVLPPSIAGRA